MRTITFAKFMEALKHCDCAFGAMSSGVSMPCAKEVAEVWARESVRPDVLSVLPVKAHCVILHSGGVVVIGVSSTFTNAMEVIP